MKLNVLLILLQNFLNALADNNSSQMIKGNSQLLVVDTDAGADDAMAILTLLGMEKKNENTYKIQMITCVSGNTKVDNVVVNILKTLHTANRLDIPVYKGAARPILNEYHIIEYFGKDGFGDFIYPNAPNPEDYLKSELAALALIKCVKENPGEVTILALGPLTNIALATILDEQFLSNIKELIIMSGSFAGSLEFNAKSDPEANRIVFSTKPHPNITMIPIETCRGENLTKEWRQDVLGKLPSKTMWLLNKSEQVVLSRVTENNEWDSADTVAALVLARPDIITKSDYQMVVAETSGLYGRGSTFINRKLMDQANIHIVRKFDAEKFKDLLLKYLNF